MSDRNLPSSSSAHPLLTFIRRDLWAVFALVSVVTSYCFVVFLAAIDVRLFHNLPAIIVIYVCDVIYLIDILLRLKALLQTSSKIVTLRRVKVYRTLAFVIDLLSLLPLEVTILIYFGYEHLSEFNLTALSALRLNRCLRLYRVATFYSGKTKELRLNLYSREIVAILICFACFLVILFHGVTCLWYLIICKPIWENKPPICTIDLGSPNATSENSRIQHGHPYYSHIDRTTGDSFGWYIGNLHWTVMSIRNSGNRHTSPGSGVNMLISSAVMFFGTVMSMVITAFLIYILSELDLRRSIFFHEAYAVKSFVKHFDLMRSVANFSDSCFNYMWERNRGYSDHTMKPILPKAVQTEVGVGMMQSMVDVSEILAVLTKEQLATLSLNSELKHFFPNEFLIRPNTVVNSAFYIVSGKIEILSRDDGVTPIVLLSKGTLIAEVNLIYPSVRRNGVKTRTPCDIIVLHSTAMAQILSEFPETEETIRSIIKSRVAWVKSKWRSRTSLHELEDPLPLRQIKSTEADEKDNLSESANPDEEDDGGVDKEEFRRSRSFHLTPRDWRRATGTQFMSVLAWLSYLKEEKMDQPASPNYKQILAHLHHRYRNQASVRMLKILKLQYEPKYSFPRCVISKDCVFYPIWRAFVTLMIIANTFAYPILVILNKPVNSPIYIAVDTVYGLDLFFRLFIFLDPAEMDPVASMWSHFKHEICMPNILVDVIPVLPLYLLATTIMIEGRAILYMKMNVNFKFIRVILMFRSWENDVRVKIFTVRFFKNFLYISIFIFWLGSTFTIAGCSSYLDCEATVCPASPTWVPCYKSTAYTYDFSHKTDSVFLLALYWAICTTCGIGFNDIELRTKEETAIHSIGLLAGFCFITYFYADLASTLAGALENEINHQDNVIWLTRYLDEALVDLRLINRVTRYLDVQWEVLRGISSEAQHSIGFLTVSHSMYIELVVDYVAHYLYKTHLFKHVDTDTMRKFCLAAKLAVLPPNEIIVCYGDFLRRMYVVRRGFVQVYLADSNTTVAILSPGHSFGEINMLFGIGSQVSLRSITYVEMIVLDSSAFERILPNCTFFSEAIDALRVDYQGIQAFQRKFSLEGGKQHKRRSKMPQPMKTSTFVYHKKIKTSKGEIVHVRRLKNDPFTREFHTIPCLQYCFMPLTFLPKGQFILCWETVRVGFIIASAVVVPLIEAFPNLKNDAEYYVHIFDAVTLIDMIIRSHTAYHDSKANELITHPLLAAKHYLKTGFLIDFLASFPVYALINYTVVETSYESSLWAYLLRCNRLILLYRVFGYYFYRDLKVVNGTNTWKMIKLLPLLIYQAHVLGCVLATATCPATQKNPHPYPRCRQDSWIGQAKAPGFKLTDNMSDTDIYVISFYYVSTTSMGCGFGEFHPYNQLERILSSLFFFIYIFLRAYILANVMGSKCHMDHKLLGFQKQMHYLVAFIGREKLDSRLTSRIIRYYDYQWRRTQGIEPQKLFANLFPSLRKEVAMDVFEDVMRQLPELKRVPPSFLRAICVYLTPIYFLRHDIIVQKEDVCDHIYFISRGKVLEWREEGEVHLHVGEYIGVMDVTTVRPIYKYTASAITNVDIFGIRRKDFVRIASFYPSIAKRFERQNQQQSILKKQKDQQTTEDMKVNGNDVQQNQSRRGESDTKVDDHENANDHWSLETMRQSLTEIVALVIEQDKKRQKTFDEDLVFLASVFPESPVYRYLDYATFVAAGLSASLATYQWSFSVTDYHYFGVGYAMDVIYIVRMALSFRLSYFDDSGEIVSDSSEIQNKYLSDFRGFGLDFISTFPLEIFVASSALGTITDKHNGLRILWAQLRLNRVLRLVHIWLYFMKKSNSLIASLVRTKLMRLACFTLIYFHFLACALHGFSRIGYDVNERRNECGDATSSDKYGCISPERWFETKKIGSGTIFETSEISFFESPYFWSLYFVMSAFTTTAYGDMLPVTYFEKIFISLISFSSLIWLGLVLSDILSGFQNTIDTSYHLAADVVVRLYRDYGVSPSIIHKVVRYFSFAWVQNKGIVVPEFLSRAPACLKMDICTVAYGEHFRVCYLFRNLPEEFVRQATIRLRHFWVLAGDYVIRQNEIDSHIYFIHRGYVEYTRESLEDDRAVVDLGYLGKSSLFGEAQCILGPEPHLYSYRAQVNLDVVSLSPADMEELFELFPQHKPTILKRVALKKSLSRLPVTPGLDATLVDSFEHKTLLAHWSVKKSMPSETYEEAQ